MSGGSGTGLAQDATGQEILQALGLTTPQGGSGTGLLQDATLQDIANAISGGFGPGNLPSGVAPVAWYKSGALQTVSGGFLTQWGDSTDNADPAHVLVDRSSQPPAYIASDATYNNMASASFTAASLQFLASGGTGTWATPLAGAAWWVCVGQSDFSTAAQFFFDDFNTLEGWSFITEPQVGYNVVEWLSTGNAEGQALLPSAASQAIPKAPCIFMGQVSADGAQCPIYMNGRGFAGTVLTATNPTTLTGITMGMLSFFAGGGDFLNGKIAEFVVGKGNLTALQTLYLNLYYSNLFGIPLL